MNTVLGVTEPGAKVMTPSGMGTVTPLKVILWPVTAIVTAWLVVVAAAQMDASGTSLLLIHRQSPAGMATSMNCCGTVCVVGSSPSGQPARHARGFNPQTTWLGDNADVQVMIAVAHQNGEHRSRV